MRRAWTVAALVAATLAAGIGLLACGNDDQQTTAPQSLLPAGTDTIVEGERNAIGPGEGRYRARLNEICLAADRALARAELLEFGKPGPDNPPPTRAKLQRYYDEVVVPTRQGQLETMQRVQGGEERADEVGPYFAAYLEAVQVLGADLALIKEPGIEETVFVEAEELALSAGLQRCAGEAAAEVDEEDGNATEGEGDATE